MWWQRIYSRESYPNNSKNTSFTYKIINIIILPFTNSWKFYSKNKQKKYKWFWNKIVWISLFILKKLLLLYFSCQFSNFLDQTNAKICCGANKNVDSANYFFAVCLSKLTGGRQWRQNNSITNDNLFCCRLQNYGLTDDRNSWHNWWNSRRRWRQLVVVVVGRVSWWSSSLVERASCHW